MSEPPRIDPALEFGGQQPERSDQDFKQRFQGLQDSFYAHNAFYGPYPPPAQTASQTPADSADAALQAIATAAQDRRPSTPSSASVGAADPNAQRCAQLLLFCQNFPVARQSTTDALCNWRMRVVLPHLALYPRHR